MSAHSTEELQRIYEGRFAGRAEYRQAVWRVLIERVFQPLVRPTDSVLDLGCGYGEFINQVSCGQKFGMDLNPDAAKRLRPDIKCLLQDCSQPWPLPENSLEVVFTSNFFEHLESKEALGQTLDQAHRSLKPEGRLIALGPNIKHVRDAYWDFPDHYLPLTEMSLKEALENHGFKIERCLGKFLPYSMASGPKYPLLFLRAYLALPLAWKIFGKQFLIIALKKERGRP